MATNPDYRLHFRSVTADSVVICNQIVAKTAGIGGLTPTKATLSLLTYCRLIEKAHILSFVSP
jgi:hypothetical protein